MGWAKGRNFYRSQLSFEKGVAANIELCESLYHRGAKSSTSGQSVPGALGFIQKQFNFELFI
jgi:hypothetical protein